MTCKHDCGCGHKHAQTTPVSLARSAGTPGTAHAQSVRPVGARLVPVLAIAAALAAVGGLVAGLTSGAPGLAQHPAGAPAQDESKAPPAPPPAPPAIPDGEEARAPQATGARPPGVIRHGLKEPIPQPKGTIRITNYNVENLFDDQDDPHLSGGAEDKDMTKPREAREAVAAAIKRIQPDIIAMQEVESEQALRWFRDQHLKGEGYDYLVSIDSGDGRGIECSLLSRFPISDPKVWPLLPLGGTHPAKWGRDENQEAGKPILFRRGPLRATVTIPADVVAKRAADAGVRFVKAPDAQKITFFVCHQKSGGPGGYWREREALKTVELMQEFVGKNPGAAIVVCGDMNTQPGTPPIQTYLSAGLVDAFGDRKPGDDATSTHASGRVIDFIFLNDALAGRLVKESRFVLGTPDRPQGVDFRTTPTPEGWASDHLPVTVDVKVVP